MAIFLSLKNVFVIILDGSWNTEFCFRPSGDNTTADHESIANHSTTTFHGHAVTKTPVEEFWERRVLNQNGGIHEGLGGMQWELAGTLFCAWVMVYLIIWKGLHSSGKVYHNHQWRTLLKHTTAAEVYPFKFGDS